MALEFVEAKYYCDFTEVFRATFFSSKTVASHSFRKNNICYITTPIAQVFLF